MLSKFSKFEILIELRGRMFALYILIVVSFIIAIGFLITFLWSVKNNQFEDDYTPSVRILFEDEIMKTKTDKSNQN